MQREKVADPDIQMVCDDQNIFKWTALIKVSKIIHNNSFVFAKISWELKIVDFS